MTKLIFNRIDDGFIRVDTEKIHNGRKVYPTVATISQNSYGRRLWQIDIENKGHFVSTAGHDCFGLGDAKKIVKDYFKH